MSKPKFTPGPWVVVVRAEQDGTWAYIGPTNIRTFDVARLDACNPEREATARLIAAAPELYAFVAMIQEQVRLIELGLHNLELTKCRLTDLDVQAFDLLRKVEGTNEET